jgi:hypothetical protein
MPHLQDNFQGEHGLRSVLDNILPELRGIAAQPSNGIRN